MGWNSFIPLPPPGSRTHGAPPPHTGLTAHTAATGHHSHPGGPPGAGTTVTHPVSVQQQQREEREARERERERDAREREQREREREHLAAERLHRQAEARDHVVAQQRAYYAATGPAQQVRLCFFVLDSSLKA